MHSPEGVWEGGGEEDDGVVWERKGEEEGQREWRSVSGGKGKRRGDAGIGENG
jgi:hypothetical protein